VSKERRLGRGLEALLGQMPARNTAAPAAQNSPLGGTTPAAAGEGQMATATGALPSSPAARDAVAGGADAQIVAGVLKAGVEQIDTNPHQPRQQYDSAEIQALAESLTAHGLLQPVVVRRVGNRFQLVAGERRLRAAVQAGWTEVPVHVVEADDREMAELAIIENLHRKDLNPLEKAQSFQRYLEQYKATQEELATRLNLDRSTIANFIRLLELPGEVQQAVRKGLVTQGHARALLPLGDEQEQIACCARIQREGLSVRQTETMVQEMIEAADAEPLSVIGRDGKPRRARRGQSEHVAALEQEFRGALGLKVKITHNAHGRGKLVIQFRDHDEFEQLRKHICGTVHPARRSQAS
jgi:ParB family transcriptional regulator, chromosome partitioning protein